MEGDHQVRFCEDCQRHVYNFSAMSEAEINHLVSQREGRLCARFYQRADGTMLSSNCPVGFRTAILRATGFATATLSTLLSFVPAASAQSTNKKTETSQSKLSPISIFLEVSYLDGSFASGADVTAKNESTGAEVSAKTDDAGQVQIVSLPKGQYQITIHQSGFMTKTLQHYTAPNHSMTKVQLELLVMGEIVIIDHNPVKRFFSKLRRSV
jgi:hypothetical protein